MSDVFFSRKSRADRSRASARSSSYRARTDSPGEGTRATGARLDRFGIIATWVDGNGQVIDFDDLADTFRR